MSCGNPGAASARRVHERQERPRPLAKTGVASADWVPCARLGNLPSKCLQSGWKNTARSTRRARNTQRAMQCLDRIGNQNFRTALSVIFFKILSVQIQKIGEWQPRFGGFHSPLYLARTIFACENRATTFANLGLVPPIAFAPIMPLDILVTRTLHGTRRL